MGQFNSHLPLLSHSLIRTPEEHIVEVVVAIVVVRRIHSTVGIVVEGE